MKTFAAWIFIIIWFCHLAIGAAAWAAAFRIWPEKQNPFVKYTMIHLHAAVFDSLGAIVTLFLAKDVRFTWKFSIAVFSFMLFRDTVRLPLILFVLRGPSKSQQEDMSVSDDKEKKDKPVHEHPDLPHTPPQPLGDVEDPGKNPPPPPPDPPPGG